MTFAARRCALVLVPALIVTAAAVCAPAGAAPASPPATSPPSASTIVLPTGERLEVTSPASHAQVVQHTGSPAVTVVRSGAHTLLIPREALGYLGRLDPALFDAAQLAAHQDRLPVVITGSATSIAGVTITSRSGSTARGYITPQSAPKLGAALRSRGALPGVQRLGLDVAPAVTPDFPQVTLDIKILSPSGVKPDGTLLLLVNTDDERKANLAFGLDGNDQRVSVPKGHYSLMAFTVVVAPSGDSGTARFGFSPSVTVSHDGQSAVVDTRGATRDGFPTFITPRRTTLAWRDLTYQITDDRGVYADGVETSDFDGTARVLAPAVRGGAHGLLSSVAYASLREPGADNPNRYYLSAGHRNEVVPAERVAPDASALATVDVHAYSDGRTLDSSGGRYAHYPYFDPGGFIIDDLTTNPVRTDHVSTGGGLAWMSDNDQSALNTFAIRSTIGIPRAFPAGRITREDLFRGPLAPAVVSRPGLGRSDCQACRSASQLLLGVANFSDSDPLHVGQLFSADPPELQVSVRRDGNTVFRADVVVWALGPAVIDVPAGDHGYDVVAVRDGTTVGQKQSTHSRTEWRFRSSATSGAAAPAGWTCGSARSTGCTVLPVLTISDPLPTTLRGALPVGATQVVITAAPVAEATGTTATALSYDVAVDGGDFVPQAVQPMGGGRFLVTIHTPNATAGTGISVHVHAIDAAGGSIDQTVQTAYVVAGS